MGNSSRMTRCRATTLILNLLVYNELVQQNQALDCSGRTRTYNVTPSKAITVNHNTSIDSCWKVFAPDNDYRVRLRFSNFRLNEAYDYVEVGDLWNESIGPDGLLAKFSGSVLPEDIISLSRGMWIKLLIRKGLELYHARNLKFSLIAERRKVDINLPCPSLSPHNLIHPLHDGNYSNNGYRLWWIRTTPPCTISAVPGKLWLQESYDFVFLGENIHGPFQRRNWFNITARGEPWFLSKSDYRSRGVDLVVVFTSDFHRPKPGFTFEVIASSIDGRYVTHEPTVEYPTETQALSTTSVVVKYISWQNQTHESHEVKFYLIIIGVSAIVVAVSALILVAAIRCYLSTIKARSTQPTNKLRQLE